MTNPHNPSAEDSLIARYFKPLATDPGALGLVDDAAILQALGSDIVVTTDAVVEGVHYLATDPPDTIARKALRVNLSDLAAKGAVPAGFVLTLALRSKEDAWLRPFADALGEDAKTFVCPLLGGDTVSTPGPQMISITAFGRVPQGRMVGRTGAQPGDRILVTGTIGDAALGLDVLKGGAVANALASDPHARETLISRYRVPQPRNALAQSVRDHATAAMDVSDGLAGDLTKLCAASGRLGHDRRDERAALGRCRRPDRRQGRFRRDAAGRRGRLRGAVHRSASASQRADCLGACGRPCRHGHRHDRRGP
ncbi:thiamine-monophosphate kinase [Bradyrhizobium sp. GM5.1]